MSQTNREKLSQQKKVERARMGRSKVQAIRDAKIVQDRRGKLVKTEGK